MVTNQTKCPLWPLHPEKCEIIIAIQKTTAAFSLIGCLFVIFVIWLYEKYKHYVQRLILVMSVSATFLSIAYLLGDMHTEDGGVCTLQGFMQQFFGWATLLWVCAISIHMLLILKNVQSPYRFEKLFHLLTWVFSLFWSLWPFFFNKYGKAGIWCWIKKEATALRFGVWYIPLYTHIVILLAVYVYILYSAYNMTTQWTGTHNQFEEERRSQLMEQVKPLLAYPLIYLLLNIPTLAYRIEDARHKWDQEPNYPLLIISVIVAPILGVVNAVAFALDRETLSGLKPTELKLAFENRLYSGTRAKITHDYQVSDDSENQNQQVTSPGLNDNEVVVSDGQGLTGNEI